jgi:hypothetical protein
LFKEFPHRSDVAAALSTLCRIAYASARPQHELLVVTGTHRLKSHGAIIHNFHHVETYLTAVPPVKQEQPAIKNVVPHGDCLICDKK